MVQQPYIANQKVPQAYISGQLMNMHPKAAIKAIESLTASTDIRKAGQLTAFTHQLAQKEFFDDNLVTQKDSATIDLDMEMSSKQSPEYLTSTEANSKANRKRQIDAMNIKKTQSMKRMILDKQGSAGMSPTND